MEPSDSPNAYFPSGHHNTAAQILDFLYQQGLINELDRAFGYFLARLAPQHSSELSLAAALVSQATNQGDVCLNLPDHAGKLLLATDGTPLPVRLPPLKQWRKHLQASGVVAQPGQYLPLVLDEVDRLYLYRYWSYEQQLAEALVDRALSPPNIDKQQLQQGLQRLFSSDPSAAVNWQKIAAAMAVIQRITIIAGAPGTGKTTTLAKILVLLLEQNRTLRMGLAAPTGKAAARMEEAIRIAKQSLTDQVVLDILELVPDQAMTLHRLLGAAGTGKFHHHANNPLRLDVLVIDEGSMVDLPLMARTIAALPRWTRLILLGDRDQLGSVQVGAVLGELCAGSGNYSPGFRESLQRLTAQSLDSAGTGSAPLEDHIVILQHSHRFSARSGIGHLARIVNDGGSDDIYPLLVDKKFSDLVWLGPEAGTDGMADLLEWMWRGYESYFASVQENASIDKIFAAFSRYQVLCAQRQGNLGVKYLNERFEARLRVHHGGQEWYPGRPLMITRNDYNLGLFNGDIGIVLPDNASEVPGYRVFFWNSGVGPRGFPINRLPAYEPVFAMTIHKSQGSEFAEVLLVLPAENSRIMGRELVYTAITRARQQLSLWGDLQVLKIAATKPMRRTSGLRDKLQSAMAMAMAMATKN